MCLAVHTGSRDGPVWSTNETLGEQPVCMQELLRVALLVLVGKVQPWTLSCSRRQLWLLLHICCTCSGEATRPVLTWVKRMLQAKMTLKMTPADSTIARSRIGRFFKRLGSSLGILLLGSSSGNPT